MAEHPETYNLAQDLDETERADIAGQVFEDAKNDDESRKGWLTKHAEYIKLFNQMDEPVNAPWEGSSTESIPIMTEACVQFSSRAYAAMFPNNKIIQAIPQGEVDEQAKSRSERVTRHMTYQLIERDTLYKEDKDALLLSLAIHGSYFTKTYYDGKKNVVENVRAEDLIVPYGVGPRKIEDVDRKTHVVWRSVNWTKIQEASGYFVDHAEAYQGQEKNETQTASEKADGITDPLYMVEGRPCKIYEQHRLLDLDGDGIAHPYVATVDVATVDVATVDVAQGPPAKGEAGRSAFDRLWNRIESEQESKDEEPPAEPAEERRGLDLLPQRYLITVEDRDGSVDLVPLHRALMGVDGVEEISLVSYANGVPVISLQAEGELDLEQLDSVVGKAMDRQCEVIPQDNGKLYLRMQARED
ncbi:MAG: hypothetical protein IIB19_05400 [Chloroflexi bacterium]|nr:hypothetical protein [Chloroflexota bacterium]